MNLLDQAYNQDNYLNFLAEKFNFSKNLVPIEVESNDEVNTFKQLGTVTTQDDKELPVFEIHIKPNTQLSRNRVQLRNLVAKKINAEDGALAVYVDDENNQWRFSFIAIEYRFTDDGIKEEQTASKRFTYLLGENTQTRTAKKRFGKINKQSKLKDLEQAFAVEALSKEFYDKLYKWYEKAQTQVVFPNDEQAENHSQTSLIRLLTRLLFVWFLKEKKLINPDLFDENTLKTLIDYNEPSSFYKAILQNLFFATLNRPIMGRSFRTTTNGRPNKTNYLATNIYRYQSYFNGLEEDKIIALFDQAPFLNGDLFECLDREATDEEKQAYDNDKTIRPIGSAIRMEGFSDRDDNKLEFYNSLFFNGDENDLGLIDLFKQYQFTVEESTPLDVEIALDPELLGKVFENLLASYNPETGKQARKATGSFYTPREIVNYMVDESLKAYLTQSVPPNDDDNKFYQERLTYLFASSDKTGELAKDNGKTLIYPEEIPKLIKAISSIKIIDPAVGSGAFPMGILQRLVALLAILDPDNKRWKEQKLAELPDLQSIEEDLKTSDKISDAKAKQKAQEILEKKKQAIIDSFDSQDHNYLRKLYLIENCIYGVDIQPIAIQICKLRFFISLTIEQSPNKNKADNYGIKALPNLETKFIVANSLLPLGEMPKQRGIFDTGIEELQTKLAQVRHKHFSAKTLTTKRKYRDKDKDLREQMLAELTKSGITPAVEASMKRIVHWDLYNQNAIADWFDPEWQFGIKDGFDIVIGNPPYVRADSGIAHLNFRGTLLKTKTYQTLWEKWDLYVAFIERGFNALRANGTITYIIPSAYLTTKYALKSREYFAKNARIDRIDFLMDLDIFDASVKNIIFQYTNADFSNHQPKRLKHRPPKSKTTEKFSDIEVLATDVQNNLKENVFNETLKKQITFKNTVQWGDIFYVSKGLVLNADENKAKGLFKKSDLISITKDKLHTKPYIEGKDIKPYEIKRIRYLEWDTNRCPKLISRSTFPELYSYPKIMQGRMTGAVSDDNGIISNDSIFISTFWHNLQTVQNRSINNSVAKDFRVKGKAQVLMKRKALNAMSKKFNMGYCLAILNSKFAKWFFTQVRRSAIGLYPNDIKQLPIPKISKPAQQPFIDLVDKILTAKQQGQDTRTLETEIDKMVYRLYDLTDEEVSVIEKKV